MNSTVEFQMRSFGGASLDGRWLVRYALGGASVIAALVAYCELCSVATGTPPAGFATSVAWAARVSLGWLISGAALGTFGERVASARVTLRFPRMLLLGSILTIALFALACEFALLQLSGNPISLLELMHRRAPVCLGTSVILVGLYVGHRAWRQRALQRSIVEQNASGTKENTIANHAQPAPQESANGLIEVLTGTGRTQIRVAEIECLQADRNYISITHASGRTYLLRKTLSTVEQELDPSRFVRVHRSTVVNRDMIVEHRRGGVLVLLSGRTVSIGRAFRHRL